MRTVKALVKRNTKLFFKDKAMFFTSLATPMILLVLYATFLGNVYRDAFASAIPEGVAVSERVLNGLVGGQLLSSLLSVSCVTVAFCSNLLMVSDKAKGTLRDFTVSPVKSSQLAISYYLSTLLSTLTVSFTAMALGLVYVGTVGFYMSITDVLLLSLDVIILVLFGTALSSIVSYFLSTEGQISAVGSIVSSVYGFICGAYMPISSFAVPLQRVLGFLPGTYGTVLTRNHAMRGALSELEGDLPPEAIDALGETVDCRYYFFDHLVPEWAMYLFLGVTVLALITFYVLLNKKRRIKRS